MSIATICLVFACTLPVLCAGIAKRGGVLARTFDNNDPRAWLAKQTGVPARAHAAQQNSWEALVIFAAGVLSAQVVSAPVERVDVLAVAFVACRVIYIGLYVADRATARSLVWTLGFVASLALFFAGTV